jgi:hypothetical protein
VDYIVPSGSRGVLRRPLVVDVERVLVDMITVRTMQMPVVQIVDVIAMAHSDVPTAGTVGVDMILVLRAGHDSHHTPEAPHEKATLRARYRSGGPRNDFPTARRTLGTMRSRWRITLAPRRLRKRRRRPR